MESGKIPRTGDLESGQREMKKKIARMADMVTSLTKGKEIIDDPSLQREHMSWKDGIDPSIVPNPNDLCQ